jgi:Rrf2 family cysteine metabolism transcriptional repressor
MQLTARTEYAALAAVELARRAAEAAPVGLRAISEAQGVPARFLVHILLELKRAGIVASVRGAAGGYRLARPADAITLQEIRAAVAGADDASAPTGAKRTTRSREAIVLREAWQAAARAEAAVLGGITLADLAARSRGTTDPMYYI